MKKRFVLTKNSFHNFLGLDNSKMSEVRGGLKSDDPYYPTSGGGPVDNNPTNALECEEGYEWNPTLGMCVKI